MRRAMAIWFLPTTEAWMVRRLGRDVRPPDASVWPGRLQTIPWGRGRDVKTIAFDRKRIARLLLFPEQRRGRRGNANRERNSGDGMIEFMKQHRCACQGA